MGQAHFPSSLHLRTAEIENGDGSSFRARKCTGACACFCESKDCLRLCSAAFVAVVQTADLREFNHDPQCWRLHRPWNRRILAES